MHVAGNHILTRIICTIYSEVNVIHMKTTVILRRILLAATFLLANRSSLAYDFEAAGFYYNILDEDSKTVEVTFVSYPNVSGEETYTGEIVIPAQASFDNKTYDVTQIGWSAFSNSYITKVTIPATIKNIKGSAFHNCNNLKEAILEEGITEVADSMFYGCGENLVSVTLPSSLKTIGVRAFRSCYEITSMVFPEGVTKIGDSAFYSCNNLKEVVIPLTVDEIGPSAFSACMNLEKVDIPEGVTSIGEWTFFGCQALTSVRLPQSLTDIGDYAFYYCPSLETIDIPENVKTLGLGSFALCGLQNVELHNGLETIKYAAFYQCVKLTSIVIPHSVKVIEPAAFYGCSALKTVEIGSGIQSIGGGCFMACEALEEITVHALEPPLAQEIPVEDPGEDLASAGTFTSPHYENVALTVPVNSIPKYRDADKVYGTPVWPNFKYFTNEILTGVDSVCASDSESPIVARYDLEGRPVSDDYRGLTVIRRADGSVAKQIR